MPRYVTSFKQDGQPMRAFVDADTPEQAKKLCDVRGRGEVVEGRVLFYGRVKPGEVVRVPSQDVDPYVAFGPLPAPRPAPDTEET